MPAAVDDDPYPGFYPGPLVFPGLIPEPAIVLIVANTADVAYLTVGLSIYLEVRASTVRVNAATTRITSTIRPPAVTLTLERAV